MILNNNGTNVTSIGNIQKNQVSIDAKNINHIVTILSSNLYSQPKESFLRETISNAIDSHTEAGVKEPVIVTITDKSLAIRDYGTGISPERFKEIYLNIGSSTKRESNDYIGSFGIGRFSALSVSSLVNVTSYYEGKAYCYLMVKDATKLSIDLINTYDTDEHNGVEVKIPIKYTDIKEYLDLLSTLVFFPNIYINCTTECSDDYKVKVFNERTITTFKTFKYCNYNYNSSYTERKILVGNVLYKIDRSMFCDFYDDVYKNLFENVIPIFNIGDLDITPNRESILYSDRSKKKIKEVLQACIDECYQLLCDKYKKDYDDALEYLFYEYESSYKSFNINPETTITFYTTRIQIPNTYKGINLKEYVYRTFLYHLKDRNLQAIATWDKSIISRGKCRCNNDTIFGFLTRRRYGRNDELEINAKFLCVPSVAGFSSKYLKGFLEDYYSDSKYVIIQNSLITTEKKYFYDMVNNSTDVVLTDEKKLNLKIFFIGLLKSLKKISVVKDVMHSDEYLAYKKETAALENTYLNKFSKEVTYYTTVIKSDCYNYRGSRKAEKVEDIVKHFSSYHKDRIWVYTTMDDDRINKIGKYYQHDNVVVLSVAKTNWKITENLPKRFKPMDEFYNINNPKIVRAATCYYIYKHGKVELTKTVKTLSHYLPKNMMDKCNYYYKKYYIPSYDNIFDSFPMEKMDKGIIEGYKQLCLIHHALNHLADIHQYVNTNELFAYIGMKRKLFRVSYNVYQKIKSLNLKLC